MSRLAGKRVLVTAAGSGIGRSCVERCASEGASVAALDINPSGLTSLPSSVETMSLDGTDSAALEEMFQGRPAFDALIHCIGIVHHGTVLDCDAASWRRSFDVNVDSFFHLLQSGLPAMLDNGGGSIVCIASVASSLKGLPARAAYGATKAALIGLTKSVAADYVARGVRCNAVCPGTITSPSLLQRVDDLGRDVGGTDKAMAMFTDRQPMGRLGTTDEVADLCLYLASDESRFVTGQAFAIDGGITI